MIVSDLGKIDLHPPAPIFGNHAHHLLLVRSIRRLVFMCVRLCMYVILCHVMFTCAVLALYFMSLKSLALFPKPLKTLIFFRSIVTDFMLIKQRLSCNALKPLTDLTYPHFCAIMVT